jgi:cell wall-associated NlpC family hydrolase
MRISRRALAQAAIVSISLTGLVACRPGEIPAPVAGVIAPAEAEPTTGPTSDPIVSTALAALEALRVGDPGAYARALGPVAAETATRAGIDSVELLRVWSATDGTRMTAVLSALTQVGVGYRHASSVPGKAFDCSGLVGWAWEQAGVGLPHQSRGMINAITRKDLAAVMPGDVFYYPGHVSMALGVGDAIVHAVGRGERVQVRAHTSDRITVGTPI